MDVMHTRSVALMMKQMAKQGLPRLATCLAMVLDYVPGKMLGIAGAPSSSRSASFMVMHMSISPS